MDRFNLKWVTTWEEVFSPQMRQLWQKYYDVSSDASVFIHPAMGLTWLEAYRPLRDLKPLFCIADIEHYSLFFPLVIWRRNWKSIYQQVVVPVGFSDYDYLEPLIIGESETGLPDDFLDRLAHIILNRTFSDEVDLNGIRETSLFAPGDHLYWKEVCPLLHLSHFSGYSSFLQSLKTSLRGDLNRQQRRLAEKGTVVLRVYSPDELDEVQNQLPYLLEYHKLHFPHSYQADGFHQKLVQSASSAGILHFSTLNLDGEPISWHLGFYERGRFYYYLPAINPEFSSFSPGKIHLLYLNKWAIEQGATVFDHLRGEENYKSGWTDSQIALYQLKLCNSSPVSRFRNAWVNFKNKL